MNVLPKYKQYALAFLALNVALVFLFNQVISLAFADPLPKSEIQALGETPNWVADNCGGDTSTSSSNTQLQTTGTLDKDVGASEFTDAQGYRGDSLNGTYSFAELSPPGTAASEVTQQTATNLGKLPYKQRVAITYKGKTVVAEKLDIGQGGGAIKGKERAIDLEYDKTAQALGVTDPNNWTDVVHVQTVSKDTPLGPVTGSSTITPAPAGTDPLPSAACCDGGGQSQGTALSGNSNGEKVFNYFIGKGLSSESAAAATGNLDVESAGFTVIDGWGGGGGNYYGLAQWDRQVRYANLVKFAGGETNAGKLSYQLDFVWHELNSSYPTVLKNLKGSSSLTDKTIFWGRVYEGAITNGALQMQAERIVRAKHWAQESSKAATTTSPSGSVDSTPDCSAGSGSNGEAFVLGDYAWPVDIKKSEVDSGYPWPCPGNCHHDGTPAFDLSTKPAVRGKDKDVVGRDVFAITDGSVDTMHIYNGIAGCYSMEFRSSSDGYVYWYGHIRRPTVHQGDKVKVGQKVAEVGERKCTGNGSYPHLHIDRGSPKGAPGGYVNSRDAGLVKVMNKLYDALPN